MNSPASGRISTAAGLALYPLAVRLASRPFSCISMLYPVYLHAGKESEAHGVSFLNFAGCIPAADKRSELPTAIQEAVEAQFQAECEVVSPLISLERLVNDPACQDSGVWLLADSTSAASMPSRAPEHKPACQLTIAIRAFHNHSCPGN